MRKRQDMMKLASALGLLALLAACGSDPVTPAATDTGPPADTAPTPQCDYADALAGKNVGDLVENIKLKDSDGSKYELHSNCGVNKAIWVILATGW